MNGKVCLYPVYSKSTGFAYVKGGVDVISEVVIENRTDRDLKGLCLTVSADDAFRMSAEYRIPFLGKGRSVRFTSFPSPDCEFLSKVEKDTEAEVLVIASLNDEVLEAVMLKITVCPPRKWLGIAYPKDITESFADPSSDAVRAFFAEKIADVDLSGYKDRRSFADTEKLVSFVYNAVLSENVKPFYGDGNFAAQTVREADEILKTKSATPLEFALLLQSVFEKCSLYSELIIAEKDIFLKFTDGADKLYISVNAASASLPYEEAVFISERKLPRDFVRCDLLSCRNRGILPISSYDVYSSETVSVFDSLPKPENSSGENFILDFSEGLRRSAGRIENSESFILNANVFTDRKKIYEFLLKRFAEYGKTASFLFETERSAADFEEVKNAVFPKLCVTENGEVVLKKAAQLLSLRRMPEPRFFSDLKLLFREEERLSSFSALFTEKHACGLSFTDAVGIVEKYKELPSVFSLSAEYINSLTSDGLENDAALCREYFDLAKHVDGKNAEILKKMRFDFSETADFGEISSLFEKRRSALLKIEQVTEIFRNAFDLEISDFATLETVAEMSELLYSENTVPTSLLTYGHLGEIEKLVKEIADSGRVRDASEKFLFENFNREIFSFNVESAENQWREATEKRSVTRNFEYGKIRKSIAAFAFEPAKIKTEDVPLIIEKLREYKDSRDRVLTLGASVAPLFGAVWNRGYCEWDQFENCYYSAVKLRETVVKLRSEALAVKITDADLCRKYSPLFKAAYTGFAELCDAEKELGDYGCDFSEIRNAGLSFAISDAEKLSSTENLGDLIEYSVATEKLVSRGLEAVLETSVPEDVDVVAYFIKAAATTLVRENGELLRYGENFFKKHTDSILTVRKALAAKENSAFSTVLLSSLGTVPESEKKELISEALSEDFKSVSRFSRSYPKTSSVLFFAESAVGTGLVPTEKDFLVVFDDGNTDAEFVNSVASKYSAVIIVADAFLNTGKLFSYASEIYPTENFPENSVGYNSELSRFANAYFYRNSLKLLPSAAKTEILKAEGVSEKGVNAAEISEIYSVLSGIFKKKNKSLSVRIAAFSERQERAVRLFVEKNVDVPENVSVSVGKVSDEPEEVDYLIVTTGYSGDKRELFRYSNVLGNVRNEETFLRFLSSARKKLIVVTSLTLETVSTADYIPRSVSFFAEFICGKDFIYRENELLPDVIDESGVFEKSEVFNRFYFGNDKNCLIYGIADSAIADAETAAALSKLGYGVRVLFPADRLGIIKKEKPSETSPSEEPTPVEFVEAEFERYSVCDFEKGDMSENAEEFMAAYNNPDIRKDILFVIEKESPVSLHTLSKRVLSHWGISRCGTRLENKIEALVSELAVFTETSSGYKFYWKNREEYKDYATFRIPESGGPRREVTEISPAELANVYKYVVGEYNIITVAAAERELIKILGFSRVTDKVRKHLAASLDLAEKRGFLRTVRGKIIRN